MFEFVLPGCCDMLKARSVDRARRTSPLLRGELIGRVAFTIGDGRIALANRKSRAMLAYLCICRGGKESRERLIGLLWSEVDEDRARASLRQAIYEIRTTLSAEGFGGFGSDNLSVWLEPDLVVSDLQELLADPTSPPSLAQFSQQQKLSEALLVDLAGVDPAFDNWLAVQREVCEKKIVRDLEQTLGACPDPSRLVAISAALVAQDPTHERAVRTLMRSLAAEGDLGQALKVYRQLWDHLEAEFDIEPSRETQELVAELRSEPQPPLIVPRAEVRSMQADGAEKGDLDAPQPPQAPTHGHQTATQVESKIVIAVGKFEMGSSATDRGYLLQAFRRELIAQLVRFREWLIRDLSFGGVGSSQSTSEYVIDATGLEQNGEARLVITLMNARTGDYLWSERLPLSLDAWFDTQEEIVRVLTARLNVYLSAGRLSTMIRRPSATLVAYDRWLKAQTRLLTWTPDKGHEAEDLLQSIIKDSPDFAPAYSSLAAFKGNLHFSHPGFMRSRERHRHAREYAEHAVRLDPLDSRSHLALGWADAYLDDYDRALSSHRLAAELNDSDPWTLMSAALGEAFCNDAHDAVELCATAFRLLPSPSPANWGYRSQIGFVSGDVADAVNAASHATSILHFSGWMAAAQAEVGELEAARETLENFYAAARNRWYGPGPATREAITTWFLHLHPIRDQSVQARLADGLMRAGAPRTEPLVVS